MKIGIILYSETGHTRSVVEQLHERLRADGHDVSVDEVGVSGEARPGMADVTFQHRPSVEPYDAVVFAAPVQAFSLAVGMHRYVAQIGNLNGRRVACLVTKQLPGKWTGGYRAVRQLADECRRHGGEVVASGIVVWSSSKRDAMVAQSVETIGAAFHTVTT